MQNAAKQFIVGRESIPPWIVEKIQTREVFIQYGTKEPKEIEKIGISTMSKNLTAYPGDIIVLLEKELTVIPKDVAKMYGEKPIKNRR